VYGWLVGCKLEEREIIYIAFSFSRVTRFKNEKEIFLAFPVRFLRLEQTPKNAVGETIS